MRRVRRQGLGSTRVQFNTESTKPVYLLRGAGGFPRLVVWLPVVPQQDIDVLQPYDLELQQCDISTSGRSKALSRSGELNFRLLFPFSWALNDDPDAKVVAWACTLAIKVNRPVGNGYYEKSMCDDGEPGSIPAYVVAAMSCPCI